MWIFTNYGFVSAVKHNAKDNVLLVRAREPGVLEKLCARHGVATTVKKSLAADYLYRAEIAQDVFADIIAAEVKAIDYGNFKNSFQAAKSENTHASHAALMDVWFIMSQLQDRLVRNRM